MADLLLELFSEEIPARMQADAIEHLKSTLMTKLIKEGIVPNHGWAPSGYVTPRRLAVWATDIQVEQSASETEVKGPRVGAPEAALQGFLKKTGLAQADLSERDGVYVGIVRKQGRNTAELLKTLIEEMLLAFPWPKSMRWGNGKQAWVRPLHSILCIFDGKVIPVHFAGITAGNTTQGHRFLAPQALTITNPSEYENTLLKANVIASRDKRQADILNQAEKAAGAAGLTLKKDDGLLEEVTGLVEWPVVLTGSIDARYMDLPREVLVSEMRAHQKYFALENKDGSLSDKFLITANMTAGDGGKAIIAGNERVLRARLADGRFFWDQDRKKTLEQWAEGLKTVTYHARLGTIAEKVERVTALALTLAEITKADKKQVERAARLCKADLVTGMVGEFPELQGVMGRYYAMQQKEPQAIADAIRDHYLPLGPTSPVPDKPVSVCIALADKMDTILGMFSIGEKPTGSKDPFALRRAALGIIRIILENNIRLSLKSLLKADIMEFFIDRLKVQLRDQGIRHDVINAVVATGDDDLVRVVARAKALQEFLASEDGANLLAAYKRAANILAIEEAKDATTYHQAVDNAALREQPEKDLATALDKIDREISSLTQSEKFVEAMKILSTLRNPVDHFFDKTMVNCEDRNLRANRLRLLSFITDCMDKIGVFALIEGDTKESKKKAA